MTSVQQEPSKSGPPPAASQQPAAEQPPPYEQHQQATTHIIVAQPSGGTFGPPGELYGPAPVTITCPQCGVNITTNTQKKIGMLAWCTAGTICLIGLGIPLLWLGCCFIPFCIPALKDTIHTCPNCQQEIGKYPAGGMK